MKKNLLPMNIQFFAEGDAGAEGTEASQQQNTQAQGQAASTQAFDYDKLASIINGKQSVTEDTILKNYFKQQGLSQEEAAQAMQRFKTEKAKNSPDVSAIQTQLTQAQQLAQQAAVEKEAIMEAMSLGLDSTTIPYVLKLADLTNVVGNDGKVNQEELKKSINKVLEDVPQLKKSSEQNTGFQIGSGGNSNQQQAEEDALRSIFGIKK